jgi:phosphoserine aminotransferase
MRDAAYYTDIHYAYDGAERGFEHIPQDDEISYSDNPKYVYYCANNSFLGTEWQKAPKTKAPLIADMSSNIYSKPIDIDAHSLIFASAQKNLGIAGCCIVIVNHEFLEKHQPEARPSMFDYRRLVQNRSMLNTPPTFALYMMSLMLEWIDDQGGLEGMATRNRQKSDIIRTAIDDTGGFFKHVGEPNCRSMMNIVFTTGDRELDRRFIEQAAEHGFVNLEGHSSIGGMRVSAYNSMPYEAIEKIVEFMTDYAVNNPKIQT